MATSIDLALRAFVAESYDALDAMESGLMTLDDGTCSRDAEAVNALFRTAHTIKGSAGLLGLEHIVEFTHHVESMLDAVRAGRVRVTGPLVALLLACCDQTRALIDPVATGHTAPQPTQDAQSAPLLDALQAAHAPAQAASAPPPAPPPPAPPVRDGSDGTVWLLSLRFQRDALRQGVDPLVMLQQLGGVGDLLRVRVQDEALPKANAMDPECCYLGFEVELAAGADPAAIEAVFAPVHEQCALHLTRRQAGDDVAWPDTVALPLPPSPAPPRAPPPAPAIAPQAARPPEHEPARSPVEPPADPPDAAKLAAPGGAQRVMPREVRSVRVDAAKLDGLVDLVGELVIATAAVGLSARRSADAAIHDAHANLAALVHEVRDRALALHMVKVGASFQRFHRLVHDLSQELGKDITLVIQGEDTELDRTLVDKVMDPLTHLMRNAIDHGIERPAERIAQGKVPRGRVGLSASHDAGHVVIEVSDDGQGMDRQRLRARGVASGLLAADDASSDAALLDLVFEPGFSTAAQVTSVSGRGVGMDVVKRSIAALRGSVVLDSEPGRGTTVTVRLPLTLAIIDSFQVEAGDSVFVLPLEAVEECVELRQADRMAGSLQGYTTLRGDLLPLIRLQETFRIGGTPAERQSVVVVRHEQQRVGLVVDRLLGEAQTVIKPLPPMLDQVRGICGSSIRSDGNVGLILDLPTLLQQSGYRAVRAGSP